MSGSTGEAIGQATAGNHLLAGLPPAELCLIAPKLELIHCPAGMRLVGEGAPASWAFFPTTCVAARFYTLPDGSVSEHGILGCEGLTGVAAFLGGGPSVGRTEVVIEGEALRMPAPAVLAEFRRGGAFQRALLYYINQLLAQISTEAACRTYHPLERRLARLLLEVADRLGGSDLALTQESLGSLLGVRRETVCHATGHLQAARLITHERGHVTLGDRAQLRKAACECYRAVAGPRPQWS